MSTDVKKRETFYMAGYDPRGARHYYNFYKKEAALQSIVNGITMDISSRKRINKHIQNWKIKSHSEGKSSETNYHILEWDDIIRENWKKSIFTLFLDLLFYFKTYILAGRFIKYSKVSPIQMVGIFFPIVYLLLSTVIALTFGYYVFHFIGDILGFLVATVTIFTIIYLLFALGNRLALFWLLRIFVFSARYVFEEMETLELRLEELSDYVADRINRAKENHVDEVLLVSHSVGTILMIPLMEKILKKLTHPIDIEVSILTLGECIPLVSGIDKAINYKKQMQFLAKRKDLFWLDYTTAIDGACFPSLNYFEDSQIEIDEKKNFYFLSPRFHTLFSKQSYEKLRKNKYLTHFIYFMSTEYKGTYDYFKMTAGHQKLHSYINKRSNT